MENVVQFCVDDTSPVISYSPFRDTFTTPNLGAGWNPYFNLSGFAASIGEVGNGSSLHITSLDGASLAFQWRGTAIQLQGNVTLASYSITIDGQPISMENQTEIDNNILANIQGLEDADHNITLTAQIPQGQNPPNSSMLVFDKAVITSTPIPVSSNVSFRLHTIEDNDISFRGRWSFKNTSTGVSVHSSSTAGDQALTTFNGTTFLIQGTTSPNAANYSVTLDNVTTTYSARSSFTDYESLLFFASGLNPNEPHSVEVRNLNGGDLALLVGGFSTFISYNLLPSPTSSPTPISGAVRGMSFAKGTIAAFILAGILAFLLITSVLLFFLWYRPRTRRRRYERERRLGGTTSTRFGLDQSPKAHEAAGVLNITTINTTNSQEPHRDHDKGVDLDLDLEDVSPVDNINDNGGRRHSQLSGFARWRREAVHGSFGGVNLPLHFRHSGSATANANGNGVGNGRRNNRDTIEERPRSEMSDLPLSSEDSSARRKAQARAKSKGKARQITGRSWSPSFTLDLPLPLQVRIPHQKRSTQRQSRGVSSTHTHGNGTGNGNGNGNGYGNGNGPASARVTSVGQVSTFVAAEPSPQDLRNPAPPSYAASVSHSASGSISVSPSNRDSIRRNSHSHSNSTNPSSSIPSGPRSVSYSYSPVITDYPAHHHHHQQQQHYRGDSSGFLLHEGEPSSDPESPADGHPRLQLTPPEPEAIPMRLLPSFPPTTMTRYASGGGSSLTGTEDNPSITEPSAMREVLRSLSPRTSEAPAPGPVVRLSQWHDHDEAEEEEEDNRTSMIVSPSVDLSSSSPPYSPLAPPPSGPSHPAGLERQSQSLPTGQGQPILIPKIKPLPRPPTKPITSDDDDADGSEHEEVEEDVEVRDGVFLSVRATSPFRVDFDSRMQNLTAAAGAAAAAATGSNSLSGETETTDDMYATASSSDRNSPQSSGVFGVRRLPDPGAGNGNNGARATAAAAAMTATTAPTTTTSNTPITRIPEFIQGTSRLPFRLTPIAFPHPTATLTPPRQPSSSEGTSEGVTSFLDLTSSREGSLRSHSRSIRTGTGTMGSDLDKPINEARLSLSVPGVGVMEPPSRWSNTTVPSIATNLSNLGVGVGVGAPQPPIDNANNNNNNNNNNNSSGESQHLSPSDARSPSTDSSTFPIAVQVSIPPSPHHIMDPNFYPTNPSRRAGARQSDGTSRTGTSGFTQAGDHLHVHPALESLESPTESIPMSVSEVHFRHSDSDEMEVSTTTRQNLDSQSSFGFHPTHPPLPGTSGSQGFGLGDGQGQVEYRSRPFDPSILVSRVLALSTSASPSVDHSRSGSTAAPPTSTIASAHTHTFPPPPSRSNPNTSNDQLNRDPS